MDADLLVLVGGVELVEHLLGANERYAAARNDAFDPVAGLHIEGLSLALFVGRARADGDDLALLWFLLGGIGNDDAASAPFVLLDWRTTTRSCNGECQAASNSASLLPTL